MERTEQAKQDRLIRWFLIAGLCLASLIWIAQLADWLALAIWASRLSAVG